jgi:uncharacterized Fe-S cluster protein YjdI/CDGSH-type Zn-finger protein
LTDAERLPGRYIATTLSVENEQLLPVVVHIAGRKRMPKLEVYQGEQLDVMFDSLRCIHSRMCGLGRPDVFVLNAKGPWIYPDNATPEAIIEIAHACPSGAISYRRKDGGTDEQPPIVNLIRIRENGPYAFHGELNIAGDPNCFRATLCRCGASRNKPYCDGSHSKAGFVASGEPDTRNSEPLARRDGVLTVTPVPDGPLRSMVQWRSLAARDERLIVATRPSCADVVLLRISHLRR